MNNVEELIKTASVLSYSPKYMITQCGEVISLVGQKPKILSGWISKYGYRTVSIAVKPKCYKKMSVHRLVAEHFIPNVFDKPHVNHKNGNKLDNRVCNLEWVTPIENVQHALRTGLTYQDGEANPRSIYSEDQIVHVCELLENPSKIKFKEIVEITGVDLSTVSQISRGKIWTIVSEKYEISRRLKPKVSQETVHEICQGILEGRGAQELASEFDYPAEKIYEIRGGRMHQKIARQYGIH